MERQRSATAEREPIRRVQAREVLARVGCSDTWLRRLCAAGEFPLPKYDRAGGRRWWPSAEVDDALRAMAANATGIPMLRGAARGAAVRTRTRPEPGCSTATGTARSTATPATSSGAA